MSSFSLFSPATWFSKPANKSVAASSSASSPDSSATKAPTPLSTASTIATAPSTDDPTSVTAPSVSTSAPATSSSELTKQNTYLKTLKKCFTKPDKTVLKHPIKSTVYHVAIQVLFYSVAQSFPIFGSIVIAFSVALFERVVVLNPKKYGNAILKSLKDAWKYISTKWSKAKPAAPAPASAAPASAASPAAAPAPAAPVSTPASAPAPAAAPPTMDDKL